jgi:hypothetical protein
MKDCLSRYKGLECVLEYLYNRGLGELRIVR